MTETASTLSPGEIVGHYEIIGIAGAGGMGVVYKAFDQRLLRTVALKFLPSSRISSPKEKDRFLKEARAASALDHPNIGIIHGIEELSPGCSYIVMAFYEGHSLAHEIHQGLLPCQSAIDIGVQMIRGLEHAHRHKIVHRDIKPSNVMITPDSDVKIVDFGLAGLIKSEIETVTGETAGTIGYMSPEQTLGRPVDQRTDIWAWGVVLVEMLTGRNPYIRDGIPATVNAILSEAPHGIEQIPTLLQPIVYRALAKDPRDRYQSCAEILSQLGFVRNQIESSTESIDRPAQILSLDPNDFRHCKSAATSPYRNSVFRKRNLIATACVLTLGLSSAFVFGKVLRDRHRMPDPPKHIAVLPFDNVGNNPASEPLAAGLMETMAGKLSNIDRDNQKLWVVPASEVRRRKIADPSLALRDLGATLAVTGSLQREGQEFHLTANLIDTKNMRQLGSVVVDNNSGDLSALQDEAISRLVRLMDVSAQKNASINPPQGTPAAYENYLSAVGYMQRYDQPGSLDHAIEFLERAAGADPNFALAYAQLGEAYRLKFQLDKNPKWIDEALSNCRKAIEIDSRVTAVYVTLGRIHEMSGKHDLAVQEFQRALDFNSRDASALGGMAQSYENAGHAQEAEVAYKKAIALQPDYWDTYDELGLFYDREGRYQDALEQLQHAVSLTPDNAQVYSNLGAVYSDIGDPKFFPEAEKVLKKSLEINPSYYAYANLGNLYYKEKRYAESADITEKALRLNGNDYRVWSNLIAAYEWLEDNQKIAGANERMQQLLERAVEIRPQDALAQSRLAIVYAEKHKRKDSLIRIQTALALAPNDPEVLENVAIGYEKLGDRSKAIKYVTEAMNRGLSADDIKNEPAFHSLMSDPQFQARVLASPKVVE